MKRGEFLSNKRIEKGLSLSALAQKLGVSEEEVERWEGGELPDSRYLLPLSALLGVFVEDILQCGEESAAEEDGAEKQADPSENLQEEQGAAENSASEEQAAAQNSASEEQGAAENSASEEQGEAENSASEEQVAAQNSASEVKSAVQNSASEELGAAQSSISEVKGAEKAAQATAPPQESYYDRLHKKIGDLEYSADDPGLKETENGNGYSPAERKFGYTLFAIFIAFMTIFIASGLIGWVTRPRELSLENYAKYLEIDVYPLQGMNPDIYTVCVTAKADISDLSITVQVNFSNVFTEEKFSDTVTLSGDLAKDDSAERQIDLPSVMHRGSVSVISVSGGLA